MRKARVGVLISGRGSNMEALIAASRAPDCPYQIVLVASNNPDAAGLATAAAAGIDTFAHPHKGIKRAEFDQIIDRALHDAGVEYVALAGYMRILSEGFIAGWKDRILNIHPSLLPKYKGLDTHQRAIEAGDAAGGCSVHIVTPTLDDGPVLAQAEVPILPGDTPDSLADRVLVAEHRLYPATLASYIRRSGAAPARTTESPMAEQTPAQAEAAAVRRRWLTLGEILAVAAVLISALTLWNSYSERSHSEAEKASDAAHETVKKRTLVLRATPEKDGDRLTIAALGDQAIEGQTIRFPSALGIDPVESTNPRIEQSWFADGLKKARRAVGETSEKRGDERLPVAITTRYFVDGTMTEDTALYDVGYASDEHFLLGTSIRLRGLSLISHVPAKAAATRIDAIWQARHPKAKAK